MGSKSRHAAEIISIATANRKPGQVWIEPFVGGGNVICHVPPDQGPRIGADINRYMIALLDAVGNRGWLPPETMSKEEWLHIKNNQDQYPDELVAFAATGPTFGSVWLGPWAADPDDSPGMRYRQAREAAARDASGLKGVDFKVSTFFDLSIPPESVVYCDPPYSNRIGSERYGSKTKIEVGEDLSKNAWRTDKFWLWADAMVSEGHLVFISEYLGPPSGIYGGSPEIKVRQDAAAAEFRTLQTDVASTREDREAAATALKSIKQEERAEAARLAARWQVLWEKEVVSDFHSEREAGVKEGSREIEKLFHRAP